MLRVSPMVQPANLHEQAERCRRLARDSIDPGVRDSLLRLADEYSARQAAQESRGANLQNAGSNDRSA